MSSGSESGGTGRTVTVGNLSFSSAFDSGNMLHVTASRGVPANTHPAIAVHTIYEIYIAPDCHGTPYENMYRMWYYFSVSGGRKGTTVYLEIMNLNRILKVYAHDLHPVYRVESSATIKNAQGERRKAKTLGPHTEEWRRVDDPVKDHVVNDELRISFRHTFTETDGTVFFAFYPPFSYTDLQEHLARVGLRRCLHYDSNSLSSPSGKVR